MAIFSEKVPVVLVALKKDNTHTFDASSLSSLEPIKVRQ